MPGGGLGAYQSHTKGHKPAQDDGPKAGDSQRQKRPAVTPSPAPSPAKPLPPHPLARRRKKGPSYIHASVAARAFAGLLDGGLLVLALAPGVGLMLADLILPGVVTFTLGLLGLASLQSAMTFAHGQSLAKRWLGLRLIDADGGRVGYVRGVIVRGAVMTVLYAASAGSLLLVELALLLRGKPCLADRLAHTLVIEARTFGDPYAVKDS